MAEPGTARLKVGVEFVVVPASAEEAATQRRLADHVRKTALAWFDLADRLEDFASFLESLPSGTASEPDQDGGK